jgi:hypothetical protein
MADKKVVTLREKLASADEFKKQCEAAGVEATPRQLSKYQLKKGIVYRTQVKKESL